MQPIRIWVAVVALTLSLGATAQGRASAFCDTATHYTNVSGHCVHRPERASQAAIGWTAQCRDGTYSFSEHHRGTCSHHGGVARWR